MFQREQLRKRRRILDAYRPFMGCARCGRKTGIKLVLIHNDPHRRRCRRDLQRASWDSFWAEVLDSEVYCASCSNHNFWRHKPPEFSDFWKRDRAKSRNKTDLYLTNEEIAHTLEEPYPPEGSSDEFGYLDNDSDSDLFADV